jgi:hypothetical protein
MRTVEVIITVHVESHNKFFKDFHIGHIKFYQLLLKKNCKLPLTLLLERSKEVNSCFATDKSLVNELKSRGIVEFGLHVHPALSRFSYEDQKRIITNEYDLFTNTLGFAPKSFSGGNWCINNNTIKIISELGVVTDASVAPGCTVASHNGSIVKFSDRLRMPYWISDHDLRKEAVESNMLELPVSVLQRGGIADMGRAKTKTILDHLHAMSQSENGNLYFHLTYHSYDLFFANGKRNYMYDKLLLIEDCLHYCFDKVIFYTCHDYYLLKKGEKGS